MNVGAAKKAVIANQSADWCGNPPVVPSANQEQVGADAHIGPMIKRVKTWMGR